MLLSNSILVKCKGNNKLNIYKNMGYNISSDFLVNVEHLLPTSTYIIEAKCDYCDNIVSVSYKNYYRNVNRSSHKKYACSRLCANEKVKITTIERYGVDHISHHYDVIEKKKKTNIYRYNSEYTFNNFDIKNKIVKTNLNLYGVENVFSSDIIKNKIKETNINLYGVENVFSSDIIKNKIKETNISKYNSEYYITSEIYVNNIKDISNKIKETNLLRYGKDHPMKSDLFRNFNITRDNNYIMYLEDGFSLFRCNKEHDFKINIDNYIGRLKNNIPLCTVCNPIGDQKSIKEKDLLEFIKDNYGGEIISGYRDGLEIDIYLPELKVGFEFNGLYWHSELFKDKNYHLNKTNHFKESGIRIIHIWEDDWTFKNDIVKSQILNLLGRSKKIYARKCHVKEIKNSKDFLNVNHIQGQDRSSIRLGLYIGEELVSIMTFDCFEGRNRMELGGYNLSRFCSLLGYNVIGGASKLLSFFIKKYNPVRIVSYVDKDWSIGNLYETIGFDKISDSKPDYKYIINDKRVHKSRYRKSRTGISESKLNINKIWDSGKIKYQKIIFKNVI